MKKLKAIVFDFDGVIVDSNRLKREAWFNLFSDGDGISRELVAETLACAKYTRFEILRRIFSQAGKSSVEIENLTAHFADRYEQAIQQGIARMGVFPEFEKTSREFFGKYSLYINSATPEFSLNKSIDGLGIRNFFVGIYGSPATKEENLKKILETNGLRPEEVLVVGDGEADCRSAAAFNCQFVGVANEFNNWRETRFPLIFGIGELSIAVHNLYENCG